MVQFVKEMHNHEPFSKWDSSMIQMRPFAKEHILCDKVTGFYPEGAGEKTMTFEVPKLNDLIDSMYLQIQMPGLDATAANRFSCYAWGLGYLMWQYAELKIGANKLHSTPSDFMEIMSELRAPAGKRLREMVFKWDNVSWHNLEDLSSRPFTMWVPLRFFFSDQPGNAIKLLGLQNNQIDVTVRLRPIHQWAVAMGMSGSGVMSSGVDTDLPLVNGAPLNWGSTGLKVDLMIGVVTLSQAEGDEMAARTHHIVYTHFQTTMNHTEERGVPFPLGSDQVKITNHSFRYPCRSLVMAIADGKRASIAPQDTDFGAGNSAYVADDHQLFKSGVRALMGNRVSLLEMNVLDDGCLGVTGGSDVTSAGVKKYSAATGLGPWLPKNRYDYRMAGETGEELEPLANLNIKFGGDNRIADDIPGSYFRLVQPFEHFRHMPRKGIYTYSFDDDSASDSVFSSGANLTQLTNVEFTFTASRVSTRENPLELYYWIEHWQILKAHNGQIHPKFNG